MSSRANRKRARRQRAAAGLPSATEATSDGRWHVWEPNHRSDPVSDFKAALLAYATRPALVEKAQRLGLLDDSEAVG